jgi:hypothetical protein
MSKASEAPATRSRPGGIVTVSAIGTVSGWPLPPKEWMGGLRHGCEYCRCPMGRARHCRLGSALQQCSGARLPMWQNTRDEACNFAPRGPGTRIPARNRVAHVRPVRCRRGTERPVPARPTCGPGRERAAGPLAWLHRSCISVVLIHRYGCLLRFDPASDPGRVRVAIVIGARRQTQVRGLDFWSDSTSAWSRPSGGELCPLQFLRSRSNASIRSGSTGLVRCRSKPASRARDLSSS